MFEHTTEAEARKQILDLVADYCDTFHKKKEYKEGDRIPYASRVYVHSEMVNHVRQFPGILADFRPLYR